MKITREVLFEGNKLLIGGEHIKATPSEDGSLPIRAEFFVESVLDIAKDLDVTDLFEDYFSYISEQVLSILSEESLDGVEDIDILDDYSKIEEALEMAMFNDMKVNYSIPNEDTPHLPILWSEGTDMDSISTIEISALATSLALNMDDALNPIIAAKVDKDSIVMIRLNDLKSIIK